MGALLWKYVFQSLDLYLISWTCHYSVPTSKSYTSIEFKI